MNVFHTSLNDFCTKYMVQGATPLSPTEIAQFPVRNLQEQAALFENLLLFETVSIKVHGENIPLVLLLRMFGEKGLEALIEQGAIRFVLWTPMVGHMVTDVPGVNALVHGNLSSPAHSDPEQSVELGLRWLTDPPSKRLKKMLKRKVVPLYDIPPSDLAGESVAVTNSAFSTGKLKPLGFDPDKMRIDNLALPERQRLSKCAGGLLEYKYLLSKNMTAISDFQYFSLFADSLKRLETASKISAGFAELSNLQDMPDLKALFPTLSGGLANLPKVRAKRNAVKFRAWLASANSSDASITKEYIEAIAGSKGVLDTKAGKFVKSLALATVGAVVGHATLGALPAVVAGGVIAQAAHPAVDATLDLLDEFLLGGLRKGWHPKMFFDDLEKLEKLKSVTAGEPKDSL
jgi:hypothetical protein